MIKINLVREGRAVRGAGALPGAAAVGAAAPANVNNIIVGACLVIALVAGLGYWFSETRKRDAVKEQAASKQAEADKLEAIIKDADDCASSVRHATSWSGFPKARPPRQNAAETCLCRSRHHFGSMVR